MDRMKTFLKYALWVIGFFILSEFLINVGLNSTYKDIERRDDNSQVSIYQAQATLVNGRIKGIVTNSEPEELNGKYICINFYSRRDVFLGRKYIQVENLEENESKPFEAYFKEMVSVFLTSPSTLNSLMNPSSRRMRAISVFILLEGILTVA